MPQIPNMPSTSAALLLLLFAAFISSSSSLKPPAIGVSFNPDATGLPTADRIASALRRAGVGNLLIHDPRPPNLLRSFLYTDISLLLALPNSLVDSFSSSPSVTRRWLSDHLLPFHPRVHVSALALGRDLHLSPNSSFPLLSPAIANLRSSLADLGLPDFPISTLTSFPSALDPAFPPSAARLSGPHLADLVELLAASRSPFLIELHPFDLLRSDPKLPLGYAIFDESPLGYRDDPATGLRYRNLFDAMSDAAICAVARAARGYNRPPPPVVAVTGWPASGARAATPGYAGRYNRELMTHLSSGIGTPMKRDAIAAVYLRELFDDEEAESEWERHWGIWYKNLTAKYDLSFSSAAAGGGGASAVRVWCSIWVLLVFLLV